MTVGITTPPFSIYLYDSSLLQRRCEASWPATYFLDFGPDKWIQTPELWTSEGILKGGISHPGLGSLRQAGWTIDIIICCIIMIISSIICIIVSIIMIGLRSSVSRPSCAACRFFLLREARCDAVKSPSPPLQCLPKHAVASTSVYRSIVILYILYTVYCMYYNII